MRRWSYFAYGVFCHLLFLAIYVYMAGFVGNILVPKSIDSATGSGLWAVGIDVALVALFGLQHSIMARPWLCAKRAWQPACRRFSSCWGVWRRPDISRGVTGVESARGDRCGIGCID